MISIDQYREKAICLISFNILSEVLPTSTFASAIGSFRSICLGVNILIHYPLVALFVTSDVIKE